MEKLDLNTTCPNCQSSVSVDDKYCPTCGQKKFKKLLPSFGQLFSQMFDTILSLESKIFRSLRDIFVPAKLSLKYLDGKRTDYYKPFRFLFITGILFLAIFNFSDFKDGFNEGSSLNLNEKTEKRVHIHTFLDSSRVEVQNIFDKDSLLVNNLIDTLKVKAGAVEEDSLKVSLGENQRLQASKLDLINKTADEIIAEQQIEGFGPQFAARQIIKLNQEPKNFIWFVISNFVWLLILQIPLMALALKLLYRRQKRFYIEHLIFLFHQHAFFFIYASIFLSIGMVLNDAPRFIVWSFLTWLVLYGFFSLLFFYKQGIFKTLLKGFISMMIYSFIMFFSMVLFMGISLMIY